MEKREPNEIVKFLAGTWTTKDITIVPSHEVKVEEYIETIKMRDSEAVTITALGKDNGKDIRRDIVIAVDGAKVSLSQGDFSATGTKKGNLVSLNGVYQNRTFDFRLYLLVDKYVYEKDVWEDNKVVET